MSDTTETTPEAPAVDEAPPQEPTIQELLDARDAKIQSSMQSWLGRRDKDLIDAIERKFESKLESVKPKQKEEFNFEDPLPQIETHVRNILTQEQRKEYEYTQSVVNAAGRLMETDDLFEDAELGNEVVEVIKSDIGRIKKNVPPDIAAELLVSNALKKVYKARKGQKKTAFDGKKPTGEKLGSVTPSTSTDKKEKMPKMSDLAGRMVKTWNYSPDDVKRILSE